MPARLRSISLVLAGVACADGAVTTPSDELLVVEAFLFAGEPVTDIRVTEVVPLGGDPADAPAVNDATVRLIRGGVVYALEATGADGRYRYPGTDLVVAVGDTFSLEVERAGQLVTARSVVPPAPGGVALSRTTFQVPQFGGPRGRGAGFPTDEQVVVSWDNPDELLHFVVIESLDPNAEPIIPEQFQGRFGGFRLIAQPTRDDVEVIGLGRLEVLGAHRVRVYRINDEYADLYENRTQDSRDLNEPPTNVRGGLGVFSAFASDSAFFTVVR